MKMDAKMKRRILCILLMIVCMISLRNLIEISQYARPAADDFNYGRTTFKAWRDTHDLTEVIKGAIETSVRFWNVFQGTYASAFLMSLHPGIFGAEWYGLTGIIMMLLIIGSTLIFSIYFIKHLFKGSLLEAVTMGIVMSTLMIQFMPSSIEGLYWFCGAIHYTFFFAILLVYICSFIELQRNESKVREICLFIICLLLVFILEGGNNITGLMGILFTIVVSIVCFKTDKRKTIRNLIILCFMLCMFFLNLFSPGSAIRLSVLNENTADKIGIIETIYTAARAGINNVGSWFGFKEICMIVITSPLLIEIVKRIKKETGFEFKYPLLVIILSVAWISMMYCPTIYAKIGTGGGRLVDIVYYSFVILTYINVIYLIGWLWSVVSEDAIENVRNIQWKYIVTALIFAIAMFTGFRNTSWGYKAKQEMKSGDPKIYIEEYSVREEILLNSRGESAEIPEYTVKPMLIYLDDISKDPTDWRNEGMAKYYEVESIVRYDVD